MIYFDWQFWIILLLISVLCYLLSRHHNPAPKTKAPIVTARVVCAANRYADGTVILGVRHHDKLMRHVAIGMRLANPTQPRRPTGTPEQGFIDNHGNFLTRKEAWVIAETAGQIIRRCGADGPERHGLFSENLY